MLKFKSDISKFAIYAAGSVLSAAASVIILIDYPKAVGVQMLSICLGVFALGSGVLAVKAWEPAEQEITKNYIHPNAPAKINSAKPNNLPEIKI